MANTVYCVSVFTLRGNYLIFRGLSCKQKINTKILCILFCGK